jgi:hypothetical protein
MKKATRRLIAAATVIGALALAPAALAQSTGTGYSGPSGVAGEVQSGGSDNGPGNGKVAGTSASSQATDDSNGVLAFTGLDLALIAGGGLVLLAGGMGLSRIVARHPA